MICSDCGQALSGSAIRICFKCEYRNAPTGGGRRPRSDTLSADDRSAETRSPGSSRRASIAGSPLMAAGDAGALPADPTGIEDGRRSLFARERDGIRDQIVRFLVHATNATIEGDLDIALLDTGRALYSIAELDVGTGFGAYAKVTRALAPFVESDVPDGARRATISDAGSDRLTGRKVSNVRSR